MMTYEISSMEDDAHTHCPAFVDPFIPYRSA